MSATLWLDTDAGKTVDLGGTIQMYQAFGEMQDLAGEGYMGAWPALWGVSTQVESQDDAHPEWLAEVRDEAARFLSQHGGKLSANARWILGQLDADADAKARAGRLAQALRDVAHATAVRMLRRLGSSLRKAARTPASFLAELDDLAAQHGRTVTAEFLPFAGQESTRAASFLEEIRAEMLTLAGEAKPADLAAKVEAKLSQWEAVPDRLASVQSLLLEVGR